MTADIIAWLRSEEGERWSRDRHQYSFYADAAPVPWNQGPGDAGEDPCGRPPLGVLSTEGGAA